MLVLSLGKVGYPQGGYSLFTVWKMSRVSADEKSTLFGISYIYWAVVFKRFKIVG
jgi:hypothetical protein